MFTPHTLGGGALFVPLVLIVNDAGRLLVCWCFHSCTFSGVTLQLCFLVARHSIVFGCHMIGFECYCIVFGSHDCFRAFQRFHVYVLGWVLCCGIVSSNLNCRAISPVKLFLAGLPIKFFSLYSSKDRLFHYSFYAFNCFNIIHQ